jgi:hypothetical protein
MKINNFLCLFLFLIPFVGCATFESSTQTEWLAERAKYKKVCQAWEETLPPHLVRTEDEKNMTEAAFLSERCKSDPYICTPPTKQQELVDLEVQWGKKVTPNGCLFNKDEY